MPKSKQFLKEPKKKSKHATPVPTNSDEYLAAGVDFEEAGEKWRGGDAVKSTRFFVRALDCYEEGLKKFPDSFDLAYNNCRTGLQYEITQHPKIVENLPGTLLELLQTALDSSRYALKLDPEDADALFTLASLLTDFAETKVSNNPSDKLQEALWLFERCLKRQVGTFKEENAALGDLAPKDVDMGEGDSAAGPPFPTKEEAWARVVEPTTKEILLETIVAKLETLSKLAEETDPRDGDSISYISDYYKDTIRRKYLKPLCEATSTDSSSFPDTLKLAIANYQCAVANLSYSARRIDLQQYEQVVQTAYNTLKPSSDPQELPSNPQVLCDYAESIIAFQNAVKELGLNHNPYLTQRWLALTEALKSLTVAGAMKDVKHREQIQLMRGDVEMMRFQLGEGPGQLAASQKNREALLGNSKKFYDGSRRISINNGAKEREIEARIKLDVVDAFIGDNTTLLEAKATLESFEAVLTEAISDGVVTKEQLLRLGLEG
ncbi:uncharacterized protein LY89DRAFT_577669 [Mollisia scopiformis]|uniref:Uncharacterized protein n=1 Tax=Mollisia scopiformis TaxID=149040 RepID=A0A194XMS0_MOLSC|nr:uncharacterized protein LY89DRAFT_577669 [Mollisia scopiformis]KUJ21453.1 hypothetical protein LY89DRAFT_577669 [Mollisia scopiformis]